jgi:N-acyl-D-aspartate/D-glutamate deacylase
VELLLDTLLVGGTVLDGTGSKGVVANVGVRGDRIVSVDGGDQQANRRLDVSGCVVAPGFVDVHTHYDAQAFWDTTLSPSPLHGVTTVMGGNCGFSIAPLDPDDDGYLMRMLARVEGMPVEALEVGVPWDWRTTEEYLARLEGRLLPRAAAAGQA